MKFLRQVGFVSAILTVSFHVHAKDYAALFERLNSLADKTIGHCAMVLNVESPPQFLSLKRLSKIYDESLAGLAGFSADTWQAQDLSDGKDPWPESHFKNIKISRLVHHIFTTRLKMLYESEINWVRLQVGLKRISPNQNHLESFKTLTILNTFSSFIDREVNVQSYIDELQEELARSHSAFADLKRTGVSFEISSHPVLLSQRRTTNGPFMYGVPTLDILDDALAIKISHVGFASKENNFLNVTSQVRLELERSRGSFELLKQHLDERITQIDLMAEAGKQSLPRDLVKVRSFIVSASASLDGLQKIWKIMELLLKRRELHNIYDPNGFPTIMASLDRVNEAKKVDEDLAQFYQETLNELTTAYSSGIGILN